MTRTGDVELDRMATRQQADGGWTVDFASASPAAALEWRGYATVGAVSTLRCSRSSTDATWPSVLAVNSTSL